MGVRHLYGDESGSLKNLPYFFVGLIITDDPQRCEAELQELRKKSGFTREIHYTSTDNLKLPLCAAMIDWFFSCPVVRFRAIAYQRGVHSLAYYAGGDMHAADVAYNVAYRRLVEKQMADVERAVLLMDDRSRRSSDNIFSYLRREVPRLVDVQGVDSHKHMLIQLCDLLTGTFYADLAGSVQNKVKVAVRQALLARMGIGHIRKLRQAKYKVRQKVEIWYWRPPKEVKGK